MEKLIQCVYLLLLVIVIAISGKPSSQQRCAIPMNDRRSIAFITPMKSTRDKIGESHEYNVTMFWFDKLLCRFAGLVDDIEAYECIIGNILKTKSKIFKASQQMESALLNIIACHTKDLPKMTTKSLVIFNCTDTQTVQPTIHCKDTFTPCYVEPINSHQFTEGSGTGFVNDFNDGILEGTRFQFSTTFFYSWHRCSSYLILGFESWERNPKPNRKLRPLVHLLQGILETFAIPTSIEIMYTDLLNLPDVVCQYTNLERLVIVKSHLKVLPTCLHKMEKLKILDASFNALESIRNITFGSEKHETYLDLSFNQITHIDKDAFSKLSSLVFLSVRSNALTEINFELPKNLKVLDLSNNTIKYLPSFQAIWKLTNIQKLVLNQNDISSIDFRIPSSLVFLDLSSNKISSVAGHVFESANNLAELLLYNNQIKLFQLPRNELPRTGLSNLKLVFLSHNLMEELDESLFRRQVEHLDLSYNQLKTIDLGMLQKANNLEKLFLQYNNITVINDEVLNGSKEITILPNMKMMKFSHNKLTKAPLSLIFLDKLLLLDFSYNEIEKCTWSDMTDAYIIKNIDRKLTKSCILHYYVEDDKNDIKVDLRHNRIRAFKDIFSCPSIIVHKNGAMFCSVKLGHNPFHCDCQMYLYLRSLHDVIGQAHLHKVYNIPISMLSKTQSDKLWGWTESSPEDTMQCATPSSLKSRNVKDNALCNQLRCNLLPHFKDCEFIFQPADMIILANCSNKNLNHIQSFNKSLFETLVKSIQENTGGILQEIKTHVYLNGNNFSSINIEKNEKQFKEWFEPVLGHISATNIEILDLSQSNIVDIDTQFFIYLMVFFPLSKLYLNDNNLTNLPFGKVVLYINEKDKGDQLRYWHMYSLTELHLYNNPWDCSCEMKWMKIWLNKLIARKIIVKPHEIKCATPEHNRGKIMYMVEDSSFCIHEAYYVAIGVISCTFLFSYLFFRCFWTKENGQLTLITLNRDEIANDDNIIGMEFDAFVSYCEADSEWVEGELIPKLQQHDPPYKVCNHKRHFLPGMTSESNEFNAIRHSRRTIIIMSDSYLEREHCRFEFTAAYSFWICVKKSPRLVVIKYPNVPIDNDHEVCCAYFRRFTYLERNEHTFDRLFQFMPQESLAQLTTNENTDAGLLFLTNEDPINMTVPGEELTTPDTYEDKLREEDERYKRLWQEAEEEAAERVAAGEDIMAEEIFITKF